MTQMPPEFRAKRPRFRQGIPTTSARRSPRIEAEVAPQFCVTLQKCIAAPTGGERRRANGRAARSGLRVIGYGGSVLPAARVYHVFRTIPEPE
jgi:hypothetical protein